ncbi:MAG TPA: DNA (cytosine-5-)-methyltransferase [Pirellulales bacterium]|jgi:DNA (cytosine-5)-methyltransferase 1|nr:DNA (cytosine-5-)-methyltransferase [Pirellulales bacterium]
MKAVELFAGIGGFRIAADSVKFDTIWANDHCPKACKVYRHNFGPNSIREGDVTKLLDEVPPHDLLTAGFPCQPFSSAGKKQGIKDPRGTLFSVVVDVLRRHQPPCFILENVKRLLTMEQGVHFATILASLAELNYRIEWRLLNAIDFGLPQNRQRVFVVGVRLGSNRGNGTNAIRLASTEDLSTRTFRAGLLHSPEFWPKITSHGKKFPNWGLAVAGHFCAAELDSFSESAPPCKLQSVLQDDVAPEFDFTESTVQRLKSSRPVKRFVHGVEILSNQGGGARMGYTVFGINGLAPTLTSTASRHYERYKIGSRYRRLTNVEYARLQGFPDDHCSAVSVYDQYALYGNAVPAPMVAWVMKRATSEGVPIQRIPRKRHQQRLFADA